MHCAFGTGEWDRLGYELMAPLTALGGPWAVWLFPLRRYRRAESSERLGWGKIFSLRVCKRERRVLQEQRRVGLCFVKLP